MVCYASLRSALFAHLHVRYTSHPHSKDVNISAGTHSEAYEHSDTDHKIANLDTKVKELKTDVEGLKTDVGGLKTDVGGLKTDVEGLKMEVKDFKTEMRDFKTDIFHKFDTFRTSFENSQKDLAHTFE